MATGARDFDGTDDYFSGSGDASAVAVFVGNYSVTWHMITGAIASAIPFFEFGGDASLETEATNVILRLSVSATSGELDWLWETGAGANVTGTTSGLAMAADTKYFCSFVVGPSTSGVATQCDVKMIVYDYDGTRFKQTWTNQARATGGGTSPTFYVGKQSDASTYFDGKLDDIAVWKHPLRD